MQNCAPPEIFAKLAPLVATDRMMLKMVVTPEPWRASSEILNVKTGGTCSERLDSCKNKMS